MALRNILNLNDAMDAEILRKKSRPVEKIDERIRTILDDMAETLYDSGGVGLARRRWESCAVSSSSISAKG